MDLELGSGAQIAIGGGLFVAGLLLGVVLARVGNRTRARLRALEEELREEREEASAYKESVAKHFDQTSDLFRDLTHQYTSLYAHLAEGARDLCAERMPALGRGFGGPLLHPGASEADTPPERETGSEPGQVLDSELAHEVASERIEETTPPEESRPEPQDWEGSSVDSDEQQTRSS
jgi:hypothetical protein